MPDTGVWFSAIVVLLLIASLRSRAGIGLAAGVILIGVGAMTALFGIPHLRDPLLLTRLKVFDYEQPQQPGLQRIAGGGVLVIAGVVAVRGYTRRRGGPELTSARRRSP